MSKTEQTALSVGIDVSKEKLDVDFAPTREPRQFANTPANPYIRKARLEKIQPGCCLLL